LVAAGTLSVAGLLFVGACGGSNSGGTAAPTSVVDSTAFRTIPVTAPPTTPAPVPVETTPAPAQGGSSSGGDTSGGGSTGGSQSGVYTVQSGDYFFLIAQKLGVDAQTLASYNDMTLESNLTPGMTLRIPQASGSSGGGQTSPGTQPPATQAPATQAPSAGGTYTVVSGDAWWLIADKLGVNVEALLAANGATLETLIVPGQKLNIPG
jgi:LysM repeat protein